MKHPEGSFFWEHSDLILEDDAKFETLLQVVNDLDGKRKSDDSGKTIDGERYRNKALIGVKMPPISCAWACVSHIESP